MSLVIDCRETRLIEEINKLKAKFSEFNNIEINIQQLDIGDIIFRNNEQDIFIIERKNVADLIASIKDGRYEEQSLRLANCNVHKHNVSYLIEGKMVYDHTINKLLFSSLFSILYYKGFSVIRTFDVQESAFVVLQTFCKLSKDWLKPSYYNMNRNINININTNTNTNEVENSVNANKSYGEVIKKTKKDNISTNNIGAIMLSQIPGVSYNIADIVITKFGSIHQLCNAIKEDHGCLNDLCYINSKGDKRKVNKTSIKNMIEFLDK